MDEEKLESKIKKAITKKAIGYQAKEVVEEYQNDERGLTLTKKRVTKKHYPPDTQAAKMLLEGLDQTELKNLSEEDLLKEKQRLINSLAKLTNLN
ncbi:MAG: hypothetical protein IKC33_00730 [Clostridia bacterium]|nr:hypothetical protein [Clostridia bacterium]MBQ3495573.1 hypothetical protein [Clostridia bacterium]MBQ4587117.1 hypothetical protein [Clostridia bacterium]MBR2932818.1 hypothetical protein [Clostridia bacterium]MBR6687927.1 hypothetical protein [Clostridia bacterium]